MRIWFEYTVIVSMKIIAMCIITRDTKSGTQTKGFLKIATNPFFKPHNGFGVFPKNSAGMDKNVRRRYIKNPV